MGGVAAGVPLRPGRLKDFETFDCSAIAALCSKPMQEVTFHVHIDTIPFRIYALTYARTYSYSGDCVFALWSRAKDNSSSGLLHGRNYSCCVKIAGDMALLAPPAPPSHFQIVGVHGPLGPPASDAFTHRYLYIRGWIDYSPQYLYIQGNVQWYLHCILIFIYPKLDLQISISIYFPRLNSQISITNYILFHAGFTKIIYKYQLGYIIFIYCSGIYILTFSLV